LGRDPAEWELRMRASRQHEVDVVRSVLDQTAEDVDDILRSASQVEIVEDEHDLALR
jgi:hypothetical protein